MDFEEEDEAPDEDEAVEVCDLEVLWELARVDEGMGLEAFESREWVDVVDMVDVCACISGFGGRGGESFDGLCV